jgi:hypothetical protein
MASGIIALIVCFTAGTGFASGFPAADAERRSVDGIVGEWRMKIVTAVTDSSLDEE